MRNNAYYAGACRYSVMSKRANTYFDDSRDNSVSMINNFPATDIDTNMDNTGAEEWTADVSDEYIDNPEYVPPTPVESPHNAIEVALNFGPSTTDTPPEQEPDVPGIIQAPEQSAWETEWETEWAPNVLPGIKAHKEHNTAYFNGRPIEYTPAQIAAIKKLHQYYFKAKYTNPKAAARIEQELGQTVNGFVNRNTTPQQLRGFQGQFESTMYGMYAPQKTKGSPSRDSSSLDKMLNSLGNSITGKAISDIKDLYSRSYAGTIKRDLDYHKPYLYGNYQEWADYAVDQGMLPDWLKPFTKDKFMFWGSLLGVGSLAVGGLTAVVRSFLGGNGSDKNQKRNIPNKQSQYNRLLNSTSMWRSM